MLLKFTICSLAFLLCISIPASAQKRRNHRGSLTSQKINLVGTIWKLYFNATEEFGTYTFLAGGKIAEDESTSWKLIGNKLNIKEEYADIDLIINGDKMTGNGQLGMNPRPFSMKGIKVKNNNPPVFGQENFIVSIQCAWKCQSVETAVNSTTFRYSDGLDITVTPADLEVFISKGELYKKYVFSGEPSQHFIEDASGQEVDIQLGKLLLDVYNLGSYISENAAANQNKTYSETGRFAVLANLRDYIIKSNVENSLSTREKLAEKSWQAFWTKFSNAIYKKDFKTLEQLSSADFFDAGGDTPKFWFEVLMADEWNLVKKAVMSGTRQLEMDDRKEIERITIKYGDMIFRFEKDNKWRFVGVMGD